MILQSCVFSNLGRGAIIYGKAWQLLPEDLGIPKFLVGKFKPRQFLQREGGILAPSKRKKEICIQVGTAWEDFRQEGMMGGHSTLFFLMVLVAVESYPGDQSWQHRVDQYSISPAFCLRLRYLSRTCVLVAN